MRHVSGSARVVAVVALALAVSGGLDARTRKGDKYYAEGRQAEARKEWDKALELYEKALGEDPSDVRYEMGSRRVRFQAGQAHVNLGLKLRSEGHLEEALTEFQKAYAIDPSSSIAEQELKRTLEMIRRNKKAAEAGEPLPESQQALTPVEQARREEHQELERIEPPPELKPLSTQPINLRMSNQPPKVLFETVGKLAGINVMFDPEYRNDPNAQRNTSIELHNSTLEQALDYLALMTKSFWKPLSSNAIFVTNDTQAKRRDYEDSVVQVFYLTNLTTPQELQEIATTLRTVANIRKVFTYNSLNALIIRGSPDEVLLAQKLVSDLDKPKSEVVVDVIVMEASKNKTRNIAAGLVSGTTTGLSVPVQFTPGGQTGSSSTDTTGATTTTSPVATLARLGHLSSGDFSITLPGAQLQALLTDSNTKILQSPQVRAASGQKATLRIGDKVPIASGGVQPFGGTTAGYGQLYSQFQFLDVGVNVDITPTVHGDDQVTLKAVLEISTVRDHVDIGGISQPIIGQRKVDHEIRIREGEVSLLGGLMQDQDTKSLSGIPGLMSIPILRRLFSSENVTRSSSELLIALIPHIVRTPGITDLDLRPVSAGSDTVTRLNLAPRPLTEQQAAPQAPAAPAAPAPAKPAAPAPQPSSAMQLMLRPVLTQAQVGNTITLQLEVENAQDLFAAPFHLKFDPKLLRLVDVRAGGLLSGDGQTIIFTRNILNDTGDATVNLNRMPGTAGVSGSGSLAVFTFQTLKPGETAVTFSELTPRNSQLQPIQAAIPQATVRIK
jgi:general secretion pathway protein D